VTDIGSAKEAKAPKVRFALASTFIYLNGNRVSFRPQGLCCSSTPIKYRSQGNLQQEQQSMDTGPRSPAITSRREVRETSFEKFLTLISNLPRCHPKEVLYFFFIRPCRFTSIIIPVLRDRFCVMSYVKGPKRNFRDRVTTSTRNCDLYFTGTEVKAGFIAYVTNTKRGA